MVLGGRLVCPINLPADLVVQKDCISDQLKARRGD